MKPCKTFLGVVLCLAMAGVAFGQTQLVSDNFDGGTNGNYLGSNWTGCGYDGGAYSKLVYENNQAGGAGFYSQDCALYTGYGPFPSDQYASATVVASNPSTIREASVELRGNATPSTAEEYIACGWNAQDFPADYHYRIWSLKPHDPGATSLFLSTVTPAPNDVIWCEALGSSVTMKVNGTTIATVNDTSGVTTGYPGLYYIDPNGSGPASNDVIFDNFVAGSGPPLVSVTITPNSPTVLAGSFVQFTATALYADGSTAGMGTWTSSDTTVASVDSTGLAFAGAAGNVTITASSGTDSGSTSLSVLPGNGYTPLIHDSFSGPDGVYLGSNWTGCGYNNGAYSKLVYESNAAGGSGYYSQDCALYTAYPSFPSDQYATAVVVAATPTTSPQASIQLRANATPSTAEAYIACGWDAQDFTPDYHYRIWSLRPNDPGATSLYLSSITPAQNDVVWCQVLGNTVTMTVNGKLLASVTDTSGNTTGDTGLYFVDPAPDAPPLTDVIFDSFVGGRIDGPVVTAISVTPSPATVAPGSSLQFAATGTYTDGTKNNITNSVTWSSSNPSIATVNATGLASGISAGSVTITASSGSSSGTSTLTVQGIAPTVTFTGAPASASYNSAFNVTATTNSGVMPTLAGTAGVCSVGALTGTPASASATVTMLSGTGTCTLTANWPATSNYASATRTQSTAASKVGSSITITSNSPNPSTRQQSVAIGFAVSGIGAGPTGSVTVTASTGESCTGTLAANHTGTCSIAFPTGGSRTLTARYAGDSNFSASTSAAVSQTVNSPNVSLNPTSINFGIVSRNTSKTIAETVTNTGTGALINLSWTISGSKFSISSTTCTSQLNPGSSCVINVTFRPTGFSFSTGTLRLTDNAANSPQTVNLSGTGF